MTKSRLIVDGYNVVMTSPQFSSLRSRSLELARNALVNLLSAKAHLYDIVVVFDAWESGTSSESAERVRGVRVIYTRRGERADEVIERLVGVASGKTIVVSADGAVRRCAESAGCEAALPSALFRASERREVDDDEGEEGFRRDKKGPAKRPKRSKRRREWHF